MAKLLYVVGNEMEAIRLELDNVNKERERLCVKMEHVKVVHELMISMMEEEEKKLKALQQLNGMDGGDFGMSLMKLDFYKTMVIKQDVTIASLLGQ
jgi:hypothetical protein